MDGDEVTRDGLCSFFVIKKRRYCKLASLKGSTRCAQHLDPNETKSFQKRIPCPLDPKHTCLASELDKHMKKCNSRIKEYPKYFLKNCNINGVPSNEVSVNEECLSSISNERLQNLIERVETKTRDLTRPNCLMGDLSHPVVNAELAKCVEGGTSSKHLKQNSALLALLEENGLLHDGHCFVEFGAGRGQTSFWISKCISYQNSEFLLVEHSSLRHKFDKRLENEDGPSAMRLKIGIEHLNLANAVSIYNVVGHGKHLCGAATDYALQCLVNYQLSAESKLRKGQVCGAVFALCCHHRCLWSSYVGKPFLSSRGFTEEDFSIICRMSSWATCGKRSSLTEKEYSESPAVQNKYETMKLNHKDRELIGSKCKLLLDSGRLHFLTLHGFQSSFSTYIDKSISLENTSIVCRKLNSTHCGRIAFAQ